MGDWKEELAAAAENLEGQRLRGEVRNICGSYGFVRVYPEGQPREDYFFHKGDLQGISIRELEAGDILSFQVAAAPGKRLRATAVRLECERHLKTNSKGEN